MATRLEIGTVYAAGLFQGLALVTFPAASVILTSPQHYDLSSAQYGLLFLPQAVLAVVASLAGAGLARRLPMKLIFLLGLAADAASMALLLASQASMASALPILLVATGFLGLGFGLTVPALNTYAAAFFPQRIDRAVLVMNALLGLGTTLAPVLVALFTSAGAWWGLPLTTLVLLLVTFVISLLLPLATERTTVDGDARQRGLPARFWLFAAVALTYGIVETLNGNWATLDVNANLGGSATMASLALTAFWGMVTVGRLLFAAIEKWAPDRVVYRILPFVVAIAFVWLSRLTHGDAGLAIAAFGLAGLGCSAMLPLTISFGQAELTAMGASIAGFLIAAYQVGYGIAAYGVSPVEGVLHIDLDTVYVGGAVLAVGLGLLTLLVVKRRPTTVDPA